MGTGGDSGAFGGSHSPRSGWIEIPTESDERLTSQSHSPRSGWIEIFIVGKYLFNELVPLPTEWVD